MAAEDPTRPIWPSSPSPGWADGVDRLWGTPLAGRSLRILESTAPVAPVPGCNCTGQTGVFYYGFPLSPFLSPVPVADAAACCALCSATADCALGNYQHGGCQLIAPPLAPLPRDSSCVAVFPQGGAVAPLPVPANLVAEVHGPYQGGGGWPTVNGGGPPASAFDAQLPPALASASTPYGTQAPGTFTSEFGVGQPASFEIMAPTLSPTYYSMHGGDHPADTCTGGFAHVCTGGNVMAQRNYGGDDAWRTYFPGTSLNITLDDAGAAPFAAQLYLVQLATTLDLQSTVEVHRSSNRWGLLTWQLGEVWQSYGWGSLEYSSGAGSVLGGRWKPSHYMLARAYGNVAVACSAAASCFVKNDDALAALPAADVIVAAVHLRDGATVQLGRARLSLPRGANAVAWLCASGGAATPPASCPSWAALLPAAGCAASGADCVITTSVVDAASGEQRAANSQLLVVPGHLNASRAVRVTAVVGDADPADGSVPVMLTAAGDGAAPALFTMLFTEANGRFDDNFLTLLPAGGAPTVLRFLPSAPGQRDVLASTLRINTLGELMNPPPPPRPAKGSCTTRADTDVNDDGKFLPGATLADCCALCWADPSQQCLAAAFNPASPGCWLKYGTDFVPRTGIQTCVLDI